MGTSISVQFFQPLYVNVMQLLNDPHILYCFTTFVNATHKELVEVIDHIFLSWVFYTQRTYLFRRPSYGLQCDCLYIRANSLIFVKAQHMFTVSIVQLIEWNSIIANRLMSSVKGEF